MGKSKNNSQEPVLRPKTRKEFEQVNRRLNRQGFIAIDLLKSGSVRYISLGPKDVAKAGAKEMSATMGCGAWSNGPLAQVAWAFDERDNTVVKVFDKDGKTELGLGYVKWGPNNATPSVIPPLAQSSPYTAAPLRYIADLSSGLGPALMYRFPDGSLSDFRTAEYKIVELIEQAEEKEKSLSPDFSQEGEGSGQTLQRHASLKNLIGSLKNLIGDYVMTNFGLMTIQQAEKAIELQKRKELKPGEELLKVEDIRPLSKRHNSDYWRERLTEWQRTWYGKDVKDAVGNDRHIIGIKEFLEENNLNLHISQCMQDDVMLDIYFPTVGFDNKGTRGVWEPVINSVSFLPAHSTRLEKMNDTRHINHCYFSDQWRTLGAKKGTVADPGSMKIVMFPACMPQHLLRDMRYIVESNQKTAAGRRPMWVACPTFYPSLNKPYYPQPAWWSVFTSKAFDFSATILYDKYKQRENSTTWSKVLYVSLDYLEMVFADEGISGNKEAQQKYIDELDESVEQFLQRRENNGKMMRQFMWTDQKGDEHFNVKIVDVAEASNDAVKAGKEELELSTNPIFLALQVDPRLVGVPMVHSSNGGTALREMALLKQQQLNPKQRLYEGFLNSVLRFNGWDNDGCAEFHIKQQTFTTLDNSKTGTVETIAGENA